MKNRYEIRGDVTVIFIKHKGETIESLISTEDLPKAQEFPNTWYGVYSRQTVYVYGKVSIGHMRQKTVLLHRILTNTTSELHVDHIDHNGLNNQHSNLRLVTVAENGWNRRGPTANSVSGVLNIGWAQARRKWVVSYVRNSKRTTVGRFDSKEEARKALEVALLNETKTEVQR